MQLQNLFKFREDADGREAKPFLDHLEDLRWTIIKMALTLVVTMGASFFFSKDLVELIEHPLREIDPDLIAKLQVLGVVDAVTISFSLAFYAGLVLAFPLLLFFLAQFVLPALSRHEKKYILPGVLVGFALFLGGVAFAYFEILPGTLNFLLHYSKSLNISSNWTLPNYIGFVTHMLMVFGLLFEMPVVMVGLAALGLVTAAFLRKTRIYSYPLLLVLVAIIAPSPDPGTFIMLAVPMIALFEICVGLVWLVEKRRQKKERETTLDIH